MLARAQAVVVAVEAVAEAVEAVAVAEEAEAGRIACPYAEICRKRLARLQLTTGRRVLEPVLVPAQEAQHELETARVPSRCALVL